MKIEHVIKALQQYGHPTRENTNMNSLEDSLRQALTRSERQRLALLREIDEGVDANVAKFHTIGAYAYAMRLEGHDWHVVGVNAYSDSKRKPHETQREFAKRCTHNASQCAHAFAKRYDYPWPPTLPSVQS